ncbi:CocE/NonD family hydrolase [Microbacterium lushaniae]|uniref:CocE/NonD family hydrolase n=1 Tax=Microbacterium lushaniae TaxID=2614639 RepID=A0A5J6L6P0_9MICO|nr:CocE/NonD family hydrolase [Microbacterium lushaniae]QEW04080.1 CocE/NonD family hydrolase [Microbacterium lushaniae]
MSGASSSSAPPALVDAPRLRRAARSEYRRLEAATGMPPRTHTGVRVQRDLRVPATDGAALLTDHWFAEDAGEATILIRTPYGRRGMAAVATFFAERGHHVVIQSVRGTFGSGGWFYPLRHEAADGQATMAWLRAQPWSTGPVISWGFSYAGTTQWALCEGPHRPDALIVGLSARSIDRAMIYAGGGFSMETAVTWAYALDMQERPLIVRLWKLLRAKSRISRGSLAVPPETAVRVATGARAGFFPDWLAHSGPDDAWWQPMRFASDARAVPTVTVIAGWHDLFLAGGVGDYQALHAAGRPVRLIVGDWTHDGPDAGVHAVREALRRLSDPVALATESPVRVEVGGDGGWRDLAAWPPLTTGDRWLLAPGDRLDPVTATHAGSSEDTVAYTYDPAHPTPQGGGRSLNPFTSGRRDQRDRERRADVLVFTGTPLPHDTVIAGEATVDLTFTSTNPRVDFFLRLCDVDVQGRARTITDVYRRMDAVGAVSDRRSVRLTLSPTAYRVAAGHRLRLQVSSGAHPLHLRNSGTADPLHDFGRLVPSAQRIVLGGARPSQLTVPVAE